MSRECLENGQCPRIQEILGSARSRNIMSVGLGFSPDLVAGSNTQKLLKACADSYGCRGPQQVTVDVDHGFLRPKMVRETQIVCGLEKPSHTS